MPGINTSAVEVTHVFKLGFWIFVNNTEILVAFADFPWFKQATIEQLMHVEQPHAGHLYWPLLDIDLSVESLHRPSAFPLISAGAKLNSSH
jgi:Protein of unknown function (DUF2442)